MDDREAAARRYAEHLTGRDLLALADDRADQVPALRGQPSLVLDLLDRPSVSDRVLAARRDPRGRFRHVSPFLVFDGPVLAAFAGHPVQELLEQLAGRAYELAPSVPPGVVGSPRSVHRVLSLVADRHLHPGDVARP